MGNTYKMIKVEGKSKREHREIMEKYLGRKLTFNETIHHRNGNKRDNSIKNLELISRSNHSKRYNPKAERIELKCPCGKIRLLNKKFYIWRKNKGQKGFYCSRKCVYKNMKKKIGGKEIDKLILSEINNGLSGYRIAKKHKLNNATVYNHLKKLKK